MKVIIICFLAFITSNLLAQEDLTKKSLSPIVQYFTLENGVISGNGAEFLKNELDQAHFTLLGTYSESTRIPDFIEALLPEFKNRNYKAIVTEIGPISAFMLNKEARRSKDIMPVFEKWNKQYSFQENGRISTPIPFLLDEKNQSLFRSIKSQNWPVIGLGHESINGLEFLIDRMYASLSTIKKNEYYSHYHQSKSYLKEAYSKRNGNLIPFINQINSSDLINKFLEVANTETANLPITKAFRHSIEMANLLLNKEFYKKNSLRILNEKRLFREGLNCHNLNVEEDKMMVMMDIDYLSNGFQPSAHYGMGNMLTELAAFHGKQTLSIAFAKRYYSEDGIIKDQIDNDLIYHAEIKELLQVGETDKWTIIDLRPMIEGSFYTPVKFKLKKWTEDLVKRYDLLVIPPTDKSPRIETNN